MSSIFFSRAIARGKPGIVNPNVLINGLNLRQKQTRGVATFQYVADTLTQLHDLSGLHWVFLVPLTTFGLRTVFTLPLSIWQRRRIIKQQELRKLVAPVTSIVKMRLAATSKSAKDKLANNIADPIPIAKPVGSLSVENLTPEQITVIAAKEARKRQKTLFKKYNVQMWKNMVLPLVQIPLWVTVSMGIRTLTEKPMREKLYNSDWLSYLGVGEDFYLSEPLVNYPFAIPLVLGTLSMLNVEYNGRVMLESNSASNVGLDLKRDDSRLQLGLQTVLNVARIGTVFMMGFSSQTAVILSLYWISSQLFSLLQNIFLNWLWPYQR
ncbi:Cytochrome c oxidase assembly protein COX18, mitochondrial [Nakaseomyces bracarensis]|uniref:Cytochrome c oxidase assembly protein COX18, mitochondrial n=1 Tax=Nakaseomyces bracarensis TaxID=273131 RepID=A0ABR4NNL8_9SACH